MSRATGRAPLPSVPGACLSFTSDFSMPTPLTALVSRLVLQRPAGRLREGPVQSRVRVSSLSRDGEVSQDQGSEPGWRRPYFSLDPEKNSVFDGRHCARRLRRLGPEALLRAERPRPPPGGAPRRRGARGPAQRPRAAPLGGPPGLGRSSAGPERGRRPRVQRPAARYLAALGLPGPIFSVRPPLPPPSNRTRCRRRRGRCPSEIQWEPMPRNTLRPSRVPWASWVYEGLR